MEAWNKVKDFCDNVNKDKLGNKDIYEFTTFVAKYNKGVCHIKMEYVGAAEQDYFTPDLPESMTNSFNIDIYPNKVEIHKTEIGKVDSTYMIEKQSNLDDVFSIIKAGDPNGIFFLADKQSRRGNGIFFLAD